MPIETASRRRSFQAGVQSLSRLTKAACDGFWLCRWEVATPVRRGDERLHDGGPSEGTERCMAIMGESTTAAVAALAARDRPIRRQPLLRGVASRSGRCASLANQALRASTSQRASAPIRFGGSRADTAASTRLSTTDRSSRWIASGIRRSLSRGRAAYSAAGGLALGQGCRFLDSASVAASRVFASGAPRRLRRTPIFGRALKVELRGWWAPFSEPDDGRKTMSVRGGLRGQGGPGGSQGRPDDSPAGKPVRYPYEPGDGLEEATHGPDCRTFRALWSAPNRRRDAVTPGRCPAANVFSEALLAVRQWITSSLPSRWEERPRAERFLPCLSTSER